MAHNGRTVSGPDDDRFAIPARPERRFTPAGGVAHEGGTAFTFEPDGADEPAGDGRPAVADALATVLGAERYVAGDWYDLPSPLFLVHDREVGTSFRVLAREDRLALHVLPATDRAGVRALHAALESVTGVDWTVSRRVLER